MTAIDILVIGGSSYSLWYFWARRGRWRKARSQFGALLILMGVSSLGTVFLGDLFVMHALPQLMPALDWMAIMEALHLEIGWIVIPTGIGAIVVGFVLINRGLFRLVQALEGTERSLTGELAAHERTQAALRGSEERLRQILAIAPEGVLLVDQDFKIRVFNRAAETFFGYRAEEVLGSPVFLLTSVRLRAPNRERLAQFARAPDASRGLVEPESVTCLRKDGSEFPAEVAVSKFPWDGETVFTIMVRDITAREQREAQLRHAQRMEAIGQLTGGVAHDFNNLLAVILGNIELAEERFDGDDETANLLTAAARAAECGAALTQRLLAYSRKQLLRPENIDLDVLVTDMTELLRRALGARIEVEAVSAGGLWGCRTDRAQLETALLNLAFNARDAMPKGGKLTIETANTRLDEDHADITDEVSPGEYVLVTVTDTGTGMSADVARNAFDPFFTTRDVGEGTGLGLSMVYGFVKQSGGHVNIRSELGNGTSVKLYLPRDRGTDMRSDARPEEGEAPLGTRQTILVVEDDDNVRELAVRLLESLDYAVLEAASGAEALAILATDTRVALLFSDVVLAGGMSGPELAREATSRDPSLKVLYSSGYANAAIARHGPLDEGAGLLTKPFTRSSLARKIHEALRDPSEAVIAPPALQC